MRRTILLAGILPFVSAFLGGVLAFSLTVPTMVEAQQARMQAESVSVVGGNGLEQVVLQSYPTGGGTVQILSAEGKARVQAGTGGATPGGPRAGQPNPAAAGLTVRAVDGDTLVARLGTDDRGSELYLSDDQ